MKDRLPPPFGERIDRNRPVRFRFEGQAYTGCAGDTLSSALYANGVRMLGRSFKYHRPRGICSLANHDCNAMFQDGQRLNIRADVTTVWEGADLTAVNTFGGLRGDWGRWLDYFSAFLPVGFYYKTFHTPLWLFPFWERQIRAAAGLGAIDRRHPRIRTPKDYGFCDAITLGEMGDERCVEPLGRALRDGDWQVREVAIEGLGQIGSPAVELLIKLLRDWDVRKYAIAALGKIRDERVLDPLMLQLRNDEFKDDALNALVDLGQPALPRLVAALKDKDENVRKQAVLALGRIKHAEAIDPLIDMLADSDWFTRLTSAAALEAIGDDRGREAIKPLMKDPDMVVRMRVERILAKWKKKQPAAT